MVDQLLIWWEEGSAHGDSHINIRLCWLYTQNQSSSESPPKLLIQSRFCTRKKYNETKYVYNALYTHYTSSWVYSTRIYFKYTKWLGKCRLSTSDFMCSNLIGHEINAALGHLLNSGNKSLSFSSIQSTIYTGSSNLFLYPSTHLHIYTSTQVPPTFPSTHLLIYTSTHLHRFLQPFPLPIYRKINLIKF